MPSRLPGPGQALAMACASTSTATTRPGNCGSKRRPHCHACAAWRATHLPSPQLLAEALNRPRFQISNHSWVSTYLYQRTENALNDRTDELRPKLACASTIGASPLDLLNFNISATSQPHAPGHSLRPILVTQTRTHAISSSRPCRKCPMRGVGRDFVCPKLSQGEGGRPRALRAR